MNVFSQNIWLQKASFAGSVRSRAVGFSIGNKGYIGTGYFNVAPYFMNDFWEYDTTSDSWTQKADFAGLARGNAIGFSIGNKGYVGTGQDINGLVDRDFWEYDPALNVWTAKADFGGAARHTAVGFSIGNYGFVGTGSTLTLYNYFNDFWMYDPAADTWVQKSNVPLNPRRAAACFSIGNYGYVGIGMDSISTALNDFWEYNPANDSWTQESDYPIGTHGAVAFNIGSVGYIGTGSTGGIIDDFWAYSPSSNTWSQVASFGGGDRIYAAGFSIGSKGYIGTGDNNNFGTIDFWEYTPELISYTEEHAMNSLIINSCWMSAIAENLSLTFSSKNQENVCITLADAAGKIWITKNIIAVGGINNIEMKTEKVAAGIYFVTLAGEYKSATMKLIKE
jgi:N-acetylneuraminic acid mutarotase